MAGSVVDIRRMDVIAAAANIPELNAINDTHEKDLKSGFNKNTTPTKPITMAQTKFGDTRSLNNKYAIKGANSGVV